VDGWLTPVLDVVPVAVQQVFTLTLLDWHPTFNYVELVGGSLVSDR